MANKPNRYKIMERYMTYALYANTAVFVFYLVAAGNGIGWLKGILAVLCLAASGLLLWVLYKSRELLKQRSLWITVGAVSIAVCVLFSLLLKFPCPNIYKLP